MAKVMRGQSILGEVEPAPQHLVSHLPAGAQVNERELASARAGEELPAAGGQSRSTTYGCRQGLSDDLAAL